MTNALMYHDVADPGSPESGFAGPDAASYKLGVELFVSHLHELSRSGYRTVLVTDPPADRPPWESRAVLLTFDDGGSSSLRVADLLERVGFRGHFYVPTDCIGRHGFLDAAGVRELHQRGHLVGSHSASHPACISALPRPRIEDEWRRSTCVLSEILRVPVETASVPGGFYSPAVAEAAGAAGVKCLFTSEPRGTPWRVGSCTTYGRYTLRSGDGSPVAVARAAGEPLACFGDWLSWNARKVAKRVGGRAYQAARERVFARSAG